MSENKLEGKKLLILGSDYGTYDLVCQAKRMGVYTIVADLMETSPTKQAADEAWLLSTTDIEELERRIKNQQIDGLLAGASEFNLEKVRTIASDLGLSVYCANDRAWDISRNKRAFKDLCIAHGVAVAQDYHLTDEMRDEDLAQVIYPVMVKPVDSSGNRGQSYCFNEEQLRKGFKAAREVTSHEEIIVERMLRGPEYTGYFLIADGEASFMFYTAEHHQPGYASNLYSIKNTTACHLKEFEAEIVPGIKKVLHDAGCTDGIAFVDCMFDEDGHFYVLEMGYRLGGPVLYIMHDRISGFNTMKWMIETALGVMHTKEDLPSELYAFKDFAASYNLFTNQSGQIASIEGLDIVEKMDNVVLDMPKRAGSSVREHANMGVIRILGKSCEEVCSRIAEINKVLFVYNSHGENMFIKFDDFEGLEKEYLQGLKEFNLC